MADVAEIGFKADTGDLVDAKKKLDDLPPAAGRAERSAERLAKMLGLTGERAKLSRDEFGRFKSANDNFSNSVRGTTGQINLMRLAVLGASTALATLGGYLSAKIYFQLADTWSDLSARVGLATGNIDNSTAAMSRLSDMARRTYSSIGNTAEGFIGVADSLRELGYNTNQTLDYVEAVNNALVVSGAKGEYAESVMRQLSKAMAIGKLGGEGLETVMANGGRVAAALAKELGITQNQLRKFATEGKITSKVIYNALTKQLETLREEADSMPATVGDAFVIVANGLLQLVGAFDKFTGLSSAVAEVIISVGDGLKYMADNLPSIAGYLIDGAVAMGIMFSPIILTTMVSMVGTVLSLSAAIAINLVSALAAATSAMVAFTLANPFTAILFAITSTLAALYIFRDSISNVFGSDVIKIVKGAGNFVINSFRAVYADLEFMFLNMPTIIGAGIVGSVNLIIDALELILKVGANVTNTFIDAANAMSEFAGMGKVMDRLDPKLDRFENKYLNALTVQNNKHKERIEEIFKGDPLGAAGDFITSLSKELKVSNVEAEKLAKTLGANDDKKKKKKGGKTDGEKFSDIVAGAERTIATMQAEAAAIGLSEIATAKLKYETQLLNEAQQKGIKLSEAQRNQLIAIAHGMAELEIATKNAKEQLELSKEITKGFFSDLRSGISQGKSLWQSFGDAAMNVLNKLIDKLLNDVIDALFQVNNSVGGKGGGGGLGGLISGALGWLFSAKGNVFGSSGVKKFAKGGSFTNSVVDKATPFAFGGGGLGVMGEAGSEAVMPLKRGSDGSLGVQMYGGGGGSSGDTNVTYAPQYTIEAGATKEAVDELRRIQDDDRKQFNSKVVKTINEVRKRSNGGI